MRFYALFFVLSLYSFTTLANTSYPPVDVEMRLEKLSEHCYYVPGSPGSATENAGFISNAGVIIHDHGIVLIDALGSPSLAYKMLGLIREISDKPITHVFVTHYHADHIYGLQVFKDLGAEVIAPKGVLDYLNAPSAENLLKDRRVSLGPWVNQKTRLIAPDKILKKSQAFNFGAVDIHVDYLGAAHSHGDFTVLIKPDRVLYSGDIIFEQRIPFVGDANTELWLNTLKQLETEGLYALVPGHGTANLNAAKSIVLTHDYLAFIRKNMQHAVEEMQPFAETYQQIDWSAYADMPAFDATNRRNAYQVYLSLEQEMIGE